MFYLNLIGNLNFRFFKKRRVWGALII